MAPDPRGFGCVATGGVGYGGAGPMHAVGLAREFGIAEIVVPRFSSGFSALGCIVADMSYAQQQAVRLLSAHWDAARFATLHDGMLATLTAPLHSHGHGADEITVALIAVPLPRPASRLARLSSAAVPPATS